MDKRIMTLFLSAALLLSLTGCGKEPEPEPEPEVTPPPGGRARNLNRSPMFRRDESPDRRAHGAGVRG